MRRSPLLILLALVPVLALLASCGASGGDEAIGSDGGAETTTSAPSDGDADDDVDDPTTTVADEDEDDSGDAPTVAALAAILPTADDIGAGYTVSAEDLDDEPEESDDEEDDTTEDAILEACPGASVLDELDSSGDNPDEVSREFENDAQGETTIEVALDPTPDQFTEETVDTVVDALADCGTITTNDEDGGQIEMTIDAEKSDEYGDFGITMTMTATFTLMGVEIPIEFRGLIFDVDGTTVSVVATSGLDETTFEPIEGDYELLPELATLMEERVGSL